MLFKKLLNYVYVCTLVGNVHISAVACRGQKRQQIPEAGVLGGCELGMLGTELSSVGTLYS